MQNYIGLHSAVERSPEYVLARFASLPDADSVFAPGRPRRLIRKLEIELPGIPPGDSSDPSDPYRHIPPEDRKRGKQIQTTLRGDMEIDEFLAEYKRIEECASCGKPRYKHRSKFDCEFRRKESLACFVEEFGSLYPGLDVAGHIRYIWLFRGAWKVNNELDKQAASDFIADVFNRRGTTPKSNDPTHPNNRPLLTVDFSSGKMEIKPRTLLDWLTMSLLKCRQDLALCQNEQCRRYKYFVKSGKQRKYCSPDCTSEGRQKGRRDSYYNCKENRVSPVDGQEPASRHGKAIAIAT